MNNEGFIQTDHTDFVVSVVYDIQIAFEEMVQNDLSCQKFFNVILPVFSFNYVQIVHV